MSTARLGYSATLLPSGQVLIAGGGMQSDAALAEIFDPGAGTWTAAGMMQEGRTNHTAALLSSGLVLVAGGGVEVTSTDIYEIIAPLPDAGVVADAGGRGDAGGTGGSSGTGGASGGGSGGRSGGSGGGAGAVDASAGEGGGSGGGCGCRTGGGSLPARAVPVVAGLALAAAALGARRRRRFSRGTSLASLALVPRTPCSLWSAKPPSARRSAPPRRSGC
jgi:MYXO-CTERM domain-containing protein